MRPIVFGIHGDPSLGKTSLSLTGGNVLLLDFDMGADRAGVATDPYPVTNWDDAVGMLESYQFEDCDAIIIDTAKTALDNFLAEYVMKQDYKNRRGNVLSLQGYGALGNEFKVYGTGARQVIRVSFWVLS